MDDSPSMKMLMEPWPLKCGQCKKVWAKAPLIAQATGNAPSICPDCMGKFLKMVNDPPKNAGSTITFNSWRSGRAEGEK